MTRQEELIAKGIQYLNEIFRKDKITGVEINIDDQMNGEKRISITVDYEQSLTSEEFANMRNSPLL